MKIVLNGKEVKCHCFGELKPGDVFGYLSGQGVYIKSNQNTVFNICTGAMENYNNLPIIPYPEAKLVLDPCCHKKDKCDDDDDK